MTIFEEDYEPCSAMKCLQPWGLPFWMSKYASWMDCDWPKEGKGLWTFLHLGGKRTYWEELRLVRDVVPEQTEPMHHILTSRERG